MMVRFGHLAVTVLLILGAHVHADPIRLSYSSPAFYLLTTDDEGLFQGLRFGATGGDGFFRSGIPHRIGAHSLFPFNGPNLLSPLVFDHASYEFDIAVTDEASVRTSLFHFEGVINGTISYTSVDLENTFTGPVRYTRPIGGNVYTVGLDSFTPPRPLSENLGLIDSLGSIEGFLEVHPRPAPEPSGLVLAILGGLGFAGIAWRRNHARKDVDA